jgi:hypothetical protein
MAIGFIPNSSRKEPFTKFVTTIPMSWKLLPKEKNYLNDWNEHVTKAKLDDLRTDYFTKQKKNQTKEQQIFVVVKGREGRESGARGGKEQPM